MILSTETIEITRRMKNIFFSLLALLLFVFIGRAQGEESYFRSGSIVTSFDKEITEYKFQSLDDLNEELEEIINELGSDKRRKVKENCEILIELRLEFGIGATKVSILEKIINNCEDSASTASIEFFKRIINAAIGKEIVKSDG